MTQTGRRAKEKSLTTDVPFKAGVVRVLMSSEAVATNIRAITLDTLTMTVVAILFLMELVNLLVMREERRRLDDPRPLSNLGRVHASHHLRLHVRHRPVFVLRAPAPRGTQPGSAGLASRCDS